MRIEIPLFDGFDELDALGPFEVFRNAGLDAALVGAHGEGPVTGSHGAVVGTTGVLGRPDLVVVPGGGWNDRAARGAFGEVERGDLPRALAALHADGTRMAAVCTGGMIVAAAGLLRGRPAVTHRGAVDDLRAAGALVQDARVVDDGDIVTAGGVTSGIDLALWLVERELGAATADGVAREMEHDRRGPIWQRPA